MSQLSRDDYHLARRRMVDKQIKGRGIENPLVIEAMNRVPRHMFVDEALASSAYGDHALPIGADQTISQPFIVARMTEALGLCGDERVLEVGTGSGYQAAVLAEIAYRVYSVERLRPLMLRARRLLEGIGYRNVLFRLGDGTAGWAEQAPFDAVIVTAGGPNVPGPLLDQLGPGGRLVAPVGESRSFQNLIRIEKDKNGRLTTRDLGGCRFVDLVGRHGWEDRSVRR